MLLLGEYGLYLIHFWTAIWVRIDSYEKVYKKAIWSSYVCNVPLWIWSLYVGMHFGKYHRDLIFTFLYYSSNLRILRHSLYLKDLTKCIEYLTSCLWMGYFITTIGLEEGALSQGSCNKSLSLLALNFSPNCDREKSRHPNLY